LNAVSRRAKNKKFKFSVCSCRSGVDTTIKNRRKNSKTFAGGQCKWLRTPNPSCCPVLWDFTHRKLYHNRTNTQNSGSARDNPIEKPIGKEHDEWDFAPYMGIALEVSTKKM